MKLLPLHKLGPKEKPGNVVSFGLFLPWVSKEQGYELKVKIIHEKDQFLQAIQPKIFDLQHSIDPEYGDYWSAEFWINPGDKPHPASAWGEKGRYVYRFLLRNQYTGQEIDWIIDPFAREYAVGKLSAFTLGYTAHTWSYQESAWRTPKLQDLVIYELMLTEFGNDIAGATAKLDYLHDLGVNCLEIMPVANVANTIDWGYLPIGYFGVDERFGKRNDLQRFIDQAHRRGMAVILDVVYGHTSNQFPYSYVYRELRYNENPFMGPFAKDYFGESTDFKRTFTQDFFYTVNFHWLDCYHCDGFRYDCVPNYWDGALGVGYANLTYETYQTVKAKTLQGDHWLRFQGDHEITLVQCAEQLEAPVEIVAKTYSNCTWQNETLSAAQGTAGGSADAVSELGLRLGLDGYPAEAVHNTDTLAKSALQYIENHDQPRFICNFGLWEKDDILLQEGDRSKWYKLQPYVIGLMTAKGIPMIWQGQELGENYFVPYNGWGRVMLLRPVRWDYFYDPIGKKMISLFRKLLSLRQSMPELRRGEHYFYNHYDNYQSKQVLLFHRKEGVHFSLVALNFGDQPQWVPYTFQQAGTYQEMLHGQEDPSLNLEQVQAGVPYWFEVPGNYGRIWRI
ncbi:MAG: alpha-amylase family glycosyl hydrolase [Desulfobacteraceae bacterium]|nr:alpha-amylase family glycosyl hydrolase [Desulfobacteraceae bacterium]